MIQEEDNGGGPRLGKKVDPSRIESSHSQRAEGDAGAVAQTRIAQTWSEADTDSKFDPRWAGPYYDPFPRSSSEPSATWHFDGLPYGKLKFAFETTVCVTYEISTEGECCADDFEWTILVGHGEIQKQFNQSGGTKLDRTCWTYVRWKNVDIDTFPGSASRQNPLEVNLGHSAPFLVFSNLHVPKDCDGSLKIDITLDYEVHFCGVYERNK